MAITEAAILTPSSAGQMSAQLFAPATNVLSSALNNAVEAGRRMVDLQSRQEDMFLTEREKLRLANERKGLEARRMFESDRTFGEDVLRDRRNFAEDMFRDQRNFALKDFTEREQLSQGRAGLGIQGYNAETGRMQAETQGEYYRSRMTTEEKNSDLERRINEFKLGQLQLNANTRPPLAAQLNTLSSSPVLNDVMNQRHQNILGVGTDYFRSDPSFLPLPSNDTKDLYNQDYQQIKYIVDNYSKEDLEKIYFQLTPEQKSIADELRLKKEITRQTMKDTNPAKRNSFNLPGMGVDAAATPAAQAKAAAAALRLTPEQIKKWLPKGGEINPNQGTGMVPEKRMPWEREPDEILPVSPIYETNRR